MSDSKIAFAPATVANVACGFDVLGFAVSRPGDSVSAKLCEGNRVLIDSIEGDSGRLPKEAEKNTAGVAVLKFLETLGKNPGISLRIKKGLPLGSGMGSSAASSVAALVAVNALLSEPLARDELLPFALEGERVACGVAHADNVAPCLLGGFVLIRSYSPLDVVKLPCPPSLHCVVVHPATEVRTEDARMVLRKDVKLSKAIQQWGNVGGLVSGLFLSDLNLIGRSLEDLIIEPDRAPLIPGFAEVKAAALHAGALGCSISGSGPSMFALTSDYSSAVTVGERMTAEFERIGLRSTAYSSEINTRGAYIVEDETP